jgi:hypothetical protein
MVRGAENQVILALRAVGFSARAKHIHHWCFQRSQGKRVGPATGLVLWSRSQAGSLSYIAPWRRHGGCGEHAEKECRDGFCLEEAIELSPGLNGVKISSIWDVFCPGGRRGYRIQENGAVPPGQNHTKLCLS